MKRFNERATALLLACLLIFLFAYGCTPAESVPAADPISTEYQEVKEFVCSDIASCFISLDPVYAGYFAMLDKVSEYTYAPNTDSYQSAVSTCSEEVAFLHGFQAPKSSLNREQRDRLKMQMLQYDDALDVYDRIFSHASTLISLLESRAKGILAQIRQGGAVFTSLSERVELERELGISYIQLAVIRVNEFLRTWEGKRDNECGFDDFAANNIFILPTIGKYALAWEMDLYFLRRKGYAVSIRAAEKYTKLIKLLARCIQEDQQQ